MQMQSSEYEYLYSDGPNHHHQYLMPAMQQLLQKRSLLMQKKLRILDLGCGNGSLTQLLAQQGHEVIGVDDSVSGIESATRNFPNCRFLQGSVYDLPYSLLGNGFDVVISCEVIEHLLYPKELIRAAKKCLKPEGHLLITTPYHGYLKNLALAISGKMDKHFTVLWDGGHVKFFSVETLSALLASEKCTELEFNFAGRFPYFWKSMLCLCKISQC